MASPTRAERQARIAADDGDPTDLVYLPAGRTASSVSCYHAHVRCQTLPTDGEFTRLPRERAHELGKAPCKICVLGNVDNPGPSGLAATLERLDPEDVGLSPFPHDDTDTDTDADAE